MSNYKKNLSSQERDGLFTILKARFEENSSRHKGLDWSDIQAKLESNPEKLWSVNEMEQTGGEPDVVGVDESKSAYIFFDCATETPMQRRSLCYDRTALNSRKANKPVNSAVDMAAEIGIELLTEEQYQQLQELGEFDLKTSSWLATTSDIRKRGGAIFGDRRFGRVFIYHNGAESYYSGRGFRGSLKV